MSEYKQQRQPDKSGLNAVRMALLIAGKDHSTNKDSDNGSDARNVCGLSPADQQIYQRLEQLGYTVETIEYEGDKNLDAGRAYDKALVFISSTLKLDEYVQQTFCPALNKIPTPIIVSSAELFAPMRMTIEDCGKNPEETDRLRIFEDDSRSHPMAARLYGSVAISAKPDNKPVKVNWGRPSDKAIKIAFPDPQQIQECNPPASIVALQSHSNQDRLAIFAYESGRFMCGINAAARRIGFFLHDETANDLTPQGWVLLDVAVAWATAEKAKSFDRVYRHEWREIRRRRTKQRYQEMEKELSEKRKAKQIEKVLANRIMAQPAEKELAEITAQQKQNKKRLDELNRPPEVPPVNLTGLALSGGGIRSATFNLGLLQGFNEHGWLRMFDYLSTVSGGGFIGAWWSAWLSRSYADIPDEWLNHDALPGDKNKEQRLELEKELKVKLRFNPNQVRNARGFLRRLMLASKNNDDPRQKLSIELWKLLADVPTDPPASSAQLLTLQKLLEEFLSSEIKESSLQVKLRALNHRASLQPFFKDNPNQEQLDETINKKPGEVVDALIQAAFDRLNDRLFGDEKGLAAKTLYSWELFQAEGIELPMQTYQLSQDCPEDYRKLQLNRLLLEEVYPYELGRGVFPLQEQIDPQRIDLQEAEVARGQWVNQEAAVDVLSAGRDPLHHLRLFANYLTPQRGVLSHDTWRAVSTFSRNLLLTWVVLLPLLVVVVLLGQVYFVLTEASANNFLSLDSWMHSSSNHSLAGLAKLAAYPLGLLLSCALALAIPWLMIPEGDPWEADEKRWWRVRNPKWWAGKLRNITALLLAIATTLPAFRKHGWHRADYAYWILIPLLFTLSLVIYGYLLNRSNSRQKQWELYVRHTHLTITHSAVLVLLVVLTLVLGVAGFGPALIDYLLNTQYPKRVSLAGLLVILSVAAVIFTAVKSSPSSVSDAKHRRRPGARNRVIFAMTPPLVLIVMAILFSWLIHNLIGSLAHDNDHSIRKGLILGTCLGIAFSFFLVITEMRWEGRFPRLLLFILWVVFILWGVGALTEIVACTRCCETKAISAGHMFGWVCQQIDERTHWQQSFLADYVNAPILSRFGYGAILLAWLAGLLIGLRFVFPDSLRWKDWLTRLIHLNKFNEQSPSPQPQPASRQQTTIRWAKPSLMVLCWLAVGASVVIWFRYGRGELQPLAVFSERIFVAWGFFMCAMIAVFEIFFSRGNNVRARFLLMGIYLLLLMFLVLDLSHSSSNYEVRRVVFGLLGVLLSWVIVLGWTADPNQLSMHQFYRARLVRAYLGASNFRRSVDRRTITQSVAGDDVRIKDLENSYRGGPYHIINTTLNLVGGSDLATTQRSAAVFTLTRNYCGSSRTGYRDTREYMNGQLTLGTAVAISGAAASPSMGSITPSAAQAMLMTLLNVRLGFWAPTPNKDYWQESQARLWPFLMLREFLSQTNDLASHCYLTDGAHFENTGLYSLVERGCRFIVISDCGADPNLQFHDLGEAIRRCRIDFGAEIDLKIHPFLKKSTGESSSHFAFGKIKYSRRHFHLLHYENLDDDAREGILIVLKPVLTGDEDADLSQYGREDEHGFPHQTTADQWYDEAQFESYRRLGQITAHALIERLEKEDKKLKDIDYRLKTGSSVSSEDVRRPFDLAKKILEKEGEYKKAEIMSVKDQDEEATSNS